MIEQEQSFASGQDNDAADLMRFVAVIRRSARPILGLAFVVALAAAAYNLMQPNIYTATASLLPIEKGPGGGLSALFSMAGGGGGAAGGGLSLLAAGAGLGGKGAGDKFVTILNTRTMAETIIARENLLPVLFRERWDPAAKSWKHHWWSLGKDEPPTTQMAVMAMRERTAIMQDRRNGVINVSFTDQDAALSARVANAFVDELDKYLARNTLSHAKRNRIFMAGQLQNARTELRTYEQAMKDFQQRNHLVSLNAQAEASVKAYADLQAKLMAAQVQAKLLEAGTLEGDPRLMLKRKEVEELQSQLAGIEGGSSSGAMVSLHQAPGIGLQYARLTRELMVREKLFELLTQQYELAKIEEAQEDISFQLLDSAIPPEVKSGPRRTNNVMVALICALVAGIVIALARDYWQRQRGPARRDALAPIDAAEQAAARPFPAGIR